MVQSNKNLDTVGKMNASLIGSLDFQKFAKDATDIILNELSLAAVAIFRIDHKAEELKSYAYAVSLPVKTIDKILGIPFTKVKAPLGRKGINYIEDTANTGKINMSKSLEDFSRHVVNKKVGRILQKVIKTRSHISLPIRVRGKIEGVLFCATTESTLSGEKVTLLKTVTDQLGLSMANVIAHEQIIEQYRKSLEGKYKPKSKKPSIKFTLRIDDEIEHYLFFKTHNTKKSKAEFVRDLIDVEKKKRREQ